MLKAGEKIDAAEVGLLATIGVSHVKVQVLPILCHKRLSEMAWFC